MRVPARALSGDRAVRTFDEVNGGYSRDDAVAEARRAGGTDLGASTAACPFHVDANGLVGAIARADFDGALALVRDAHEWPGILGRSCKAYCERAAPPIGEAAPVALRELERAAATHGTWEPRVLPPASTGKHVAVVGAGSAGAAVTLGLRRLGHAVTVYDRLPAAGGMMLVGYPEFRLPVAVLRREVDIEAWGAELRFGVEVDRARFDEIRRDHDVVAVTVGRFAASPLDVPGARLRAVHDAIALLRDVKLGRASPRASHALVIGGGNTALDVARTLRRFGAQVTIAYRRGQDELNVRPASRPRFVAICADEGIALRFWTAVTCLVGDDTVRGAVCAATRPGPPDESGRASAIIVDGETKELICDLVVAAIGEVADVSFLPDAVDLEGGRIVVDDDHMTSIPGIFAAGEAAAGPNGTDLAFAGGLAMADSIDRYLRRAR